MRESILIIVLLRCFASKVPNEDVLEAWICNHFLDGEIEFGNIFMTLTNVFLKGLG